MKVRFLFRCVLAAGVALGVGHFFRPVAAAQNPEVVVTDEDNGKTFALAHGAVLVVRLQSNATTGYQWQLVPQDTTLLRLSGEPVYEAPAVQRPGAGGTQVFRLMADHAGSAKLRFEYLRSWEGNAVRTFEFVVNAR